MTRKLLPNEKLQLSDYIISAYNCVDYGELYDRFGDYDSLITAFATTTGSERALKETFVGKSDRVYRWMAVFLKENRVVDRSDDILRMPLRERCRLIEPLCVWTGTGRRQVMKYLHIPKGGAEADLPDSQ
ncbi:MAG: hypothetical protein IJ636_05640 [Bacteroidales bacterium]|nr:hypothetical protein [Bacteroidales bacterium]